MEILALKDFTPRAVLTRSPPRSLGQKEAPGMPGLELRRREGWGGMPAPHQKRKAGRRAGLSASPAAFSG